MKLKSPQTWAEIGAILQGFAAVIALFLGVIAFNVTRETQREASTQQIYSEYLKLAMDNTDLAKGDFKDENKEKYEWYVSYLLNASEKILIQFPEDKAWKEVVASQLSYHKKYLNGDNFKNYSNHYSHNLLKIIQSLKGNP